MKRRDKKLEEKLRILRQSKPREMMPRPAVFNTKKQYNRQKYKRIT